MDDFTEDEKLHLLNTMVLSDDSGMPGWPIYPFTETQDNEHSVLIKSVDMLQICQAHFSEHSILLTDNLGGSEPGYLGAERWRNKLYKLGVVESEVMLIPFTLPNLNTLTEAFNVVEFILKKGWKGLFTVAPPFHALRCFLSMITAINHFKPEGLRVYSCVGITQPWDKHITHSQGKTTGTRKEIFVGEFRSISKYRKPENKPVPLVSNDQALEYLEWRDS